MTASYTLTGTTGSSLTLNGASDREFGPGGAVVSAHSVTMDLSGLASFTSTAGSNAFRVGLKNGATTGYSGTVATVTLAASNTITAGTLALGDMTAGSDGGTSILKLGSSNTIHANTVLVAGQTTGAGRSSGTLNFASGSSTATFRDTAGTGRATWVVGSIDNYQAYTTGSATADFSNGTLDALAGNMMIGWGGNNARYGTLTAGFKLGSGTLDVTNLMVGKINSGADTNLMAITSSFTLSNGGLVTAGTVTLADNANSSANKSVTGTFNLVNGTLEATTIQKGGGSGTATAAFNWTTGTIRNTSGANLAIGNVPITLLTGTHTFDATSGQSITVSSTAPISGAGGLTKTSTGTLILSGANTYTGVTTITDGVLQVGAGGTTDSLNGNVTNTANLTFNRSDAITFGGTISGNGTLTQAGAGTLTLAGANTYIGATTVSAGTLRIGSSGSLVNSTSITVGSGKSGTYYDGGGGGGKVSNLSSQALAAGSITVTVGGGGSGGTGTGAAGGSTSVGTNTAAGGATGTIQSGKGGNSGSGTYTGGSPSGTAAGGGTGNSAAGSSAPNGTTGGAGGAGSANTAIAGLTGYGQLSGGLYYFGGGGGGGANVSGGTGGLGGGGSGGAISQSGQTAGQTNSGGGGGGSSGGGSGLAVIQYPYNLSAAAGTLTLSGSIDLQSASTVDAYQSGGLIDVTGIIATSTGSGGITIASSNSAGGVVSYSNDMTYAGNTTINSGATLILAATGSLKFSPTANHTCNKITGAGTATLNGTFNIDLTGAAIADGNSWTLVDVNAKTYGGTFAVNGFSLSDGVWTKTDDSGNIWTFTQSSGVLSLAASGGYTTWATNQGLTGTAGDGSGTDPAFNADPNKDGIQNGMAWILGADALGNPAANLLKLPAVSRDGTGALVMTFERLASSTASAPLVVQYGDDLGTTPWNNFTVATSAGTTTDGNGISIAVALAAGTTTDYDRITVTIPATYMAAHPKTFARLTAILTQ